MGGISAGMKSLCEDISITRQVRKAGIRDLREESKTIRDNARKFLDNCRKFHKDMARDLRKSLAENREGLIKNVCILREDFQKKEKEICSDLAEARGIWNEVNKILTDKKKKSK